MKARKQIIQQYLVISLLVVYQVISLVHLAQLQRLGSNAGNQHHFSLIDLIHKNHSSDNARGQYQRGITSVTENNRKVLVQIKAIVSVFSFVLAGIALLPVAKRVSAYFVLFRTPATHPYLSLCTLKI